MQNILLLLFPRIIVSHLLYSSFSNDNLLFRFSLSFINPGEVLLTLLQREIHYINDYFNCIIRDNNLRVQTHTHTKTHKLNAFKVKVQIF